MPRREINSELPSELGINDARTFEVFGYHAIDVHPNSAKKVVVNCPFCGFEYERIRHRITTRCPTCVYRKEPWPDLTKVLDDVETLRQFGYTAYSIHPASMQKVAYRCTGSCENIHVRYRRRLNDTTLCRACTTSDRATEAVKTARMKTLLEHYGNPNKAFGKTEEELRTLITSWCPDTLPKAQSLSNGQGLDILIPNKKLGIEYCGLAWHHECSPSPRPRNYHYNKMLVCRKMGLQLITIFEDEWLYKRIQIENILKARLGIHSMKVGARECQVEEISSYQASGFLENEHLQGGTNRILSAWGLIYEGRLIACATLSPHHRQNNNDVLVLSRLCFASGVSVTGGTSRLIDRLSSSARDLKASMIVSWSDNRWSTGAVYERTGFTLAEELPPDYSYVLVSKPRERISKQSQQKSRTGCPENTTEHEWALQHGLARIWDCGHKRWELPLT